ncbi:hypothetical protein ACFV2X_26745 [Streptomyces sp. NPDC059679]|uniref:hypothetical protein n=1 Tax=Streptomyces sp. NPDC059679 TaxID=3346903 RepID=UPI003694875B
MSLAVRGLRRRFRRRQGRGHELLKRGDLLGGDLGVELVELLRLLLLLPVEQGDGQDRRAEDPSQENVNHVLPLVDT